MRGLVVTVPGTLVLKDDIPEPEAGPYDALTRNFACAICNGTDLKLIEGHLRGFATYPAVIGHETVGEVLATGSKVRHLKPGDHVLRCVLYDPGPTYNALWGGFAEYGMVTDSISMREDGASAYNTDLITQQVIPPTMPPELATMVITLKEVYSGLLRLRMQPGQRIVIGGCGPVGLSMVRFCRLMGAGFVALVGHHRNRLDSATALGADVVINAMEEDAERILRDRYSGKFDLFIDSAGNSELLAMGTRLIRSEGTIGIYGIPSGNQLAIDLRDAPYNCRIQAVQWPIAEQEAAVHDAVVKMIEDGRLRLQDFVTHVRPLEEYADAFDMVRARKALKVALVP